MSAISDICPSVFSWCSIHCHLCLSRLMLHCKKWQLCMSWELHTDKHTTLSPTPSLWHASVAASIGTAVQLSPQPASQPLSKATSVETEHTGPACHSLFVPIDWGSVSGLLAAHYRWPHQPYHWLWLSVIWSFASTLGSVQHQTVIFLSRVSVTVAICISTTALKKQNT